MKLIILNPFNQRKYKLELRPYYEKLAVKGVPEEKLAEVIKTENTYEAAYYMREGAHLDGVSIKKRGRADHWTLHLSGVNKSAYDRFQADRAMMLVSEMVLFRNRIKDYIKKHQKQYYIDFSQEES